MTHIEMISSIILLMQNSNNNKKNYELNYDRSRKKYNNKINDDF